MMKTTMLWKEVSVCPYNARRTGRMQRANKAQHPGRANKSKHVLPEANLIVTRPCLKLNVPKRKYLKHHEVHDAEDAEDEPPNMWRVMSAGVDGGVFEDVRGKEPTQGEEGDESVHTKASKVSNDSSNKTQTLRSSDSNANRQVAKVWEVRDKLTERKAEYSAVAGPRQKQRIETRKPEEGL